MSENNDNKEKTIKKIWNFLERYKKSFLLVLFGAFIWAGYEKQFVEFYDDTIVCLLSKINDGWAFGIVTCVSLALLAVFLFYKSYKCYLDTVPRIILILSLTVIYIRFRVTGEYIYYPEDYGLKYFDVLFAILFIYTCCQVYLYRRSKPNNTESPEYYLEADREIDKEDRDELVYAPSVNSLVQYLRKVPKEHSFSIGIDACWGDGKSSYLNLLANKIEKEYTIIKFNPAKCKDADRIQVTFFEKLKSTLRKYNGEASTLIDNYLKVLGFVDESHIVSRLSELKQMFYQVNEEEKLKSAIDKLDERLVVIIDDIDRLTPEETLQIGKLIRYSANISNIIFISAYDRRCLNQFAENQSGKDMPSFWDKFFDVELHLPYRSQNYIIEYLAKQLKFRLGNNIDYLRIMNELGDDFKVFIQNIRDAKRFLNVFIQEYTNLKDEVVFDHYFYLKLLNYKYTEVYNSLRERRLFKQELNNNDFFSLLEEKVLNEILEEYNYGERHVQAVNHVLTKLFPNFYKPDVLRPIYNKSSFDIYFLDGIFNTLKITELKSLFSLFERDAISKIDTWVKGNYLFDLINFFKQYPIDDFKGKPKFELHMKLSFYMLKHTTSLDYYINLTKYFYKSDMAVVVKRYYDEREYAYKRYLVDLLEEDARGKYIYNKFLHQLLLDLSMSDDRDKAWILSKDELLQYAKKNLVYYLDNDISRGGEYNISQGLELLSSCVVKIDDAKRTILDENACIKMREYIEREPEDYINEFVGYFSSNIDGKETIFPEKYYQSIFVDNNKFESFLRKNELNKIKKITLVRNFWELFKSNNYTPIVCGKDVNIRKKMAVALADEVKKLNRAKEIQDEMLEFSKQKKQGEPMDSLNRNAFLHKLEYYKTELNDIELKTKEIQNAERTLDNVMSLIQDVDIIS